LTQVQRQIHKRVPDIQCRALRHTTNEWNLFQRTAALLLNTLRTGDADLRLYITTVQDG